MLHVQDAHGGLLQVADFVVLESEVVFDAGNVRGQFVDAGLQLGVGEPVHLGVEVTDDAGELQDALAALGDEVFVAGQFGQQVADLGHGAGLARAQLGRHLRDGVRKFLQVGAHGLDAVCHGFTQGEEKAPENFLRRVIKMCFAADALGEDGHGHQFDLVQGDHAVLVEDEGEFVHLGGILLVLADQTHGHEQRVVFVVDGRMLQGQLDIQRCSQDIFFLRGGAEHIDPKRTAHFLDRLHFAGEAERPVVLEKRGDHGRVVWGSPPGTPYCEAWLGEGDDVLVSCPSGCR